MRKALKLKSPVGQQQLYMNNISDTESVSSSTSGSTGSTERVKALTGANNKVWKYFGFIMNETGMIVCKARVKCSVLFANMTSGFVETQQI